MIGRYHLVYLILCACATLTGSAVAQPPPEFDPNKIQVLLITGRHVHDWQGTTPVLRQILEDTGEFEVRVTEEFRGAGSESLEDYDLVVVNYYDRGAQQRLRWGERADRALEEFVRSGKGLVLYHLALGAFDGWTEYETMSGANWRSGKGHHSPRHDFDVVIDDREHPITRGLKSPISIKNDELYANLLRHPQVDMQILATAWDDHSKYDPERVRQPIPGPGLTQPILWTTHFGEGRVFVTTLGHARENVAAAGFAVTFARGAEWAATGAVTLPIPADFAE
jgi:type 1 glutamine amidotransferase